MNYKVLAIAISLLVPASVFAGGGQGFVPIVGIPGLDNQGDFNGYINALYTLAISLAALIAVIKIVIAGAKYMLSDIVSSKSAAKDDIRNAVIGLLIIIGAVVILNTINSDLTNSTINAEPVTLNDIPLPRAPEIGQALADCQNDADCTVSTCSSLNDNYAVLGVDYAGPSRLCERVCAAVNGTFLDSNRGCLYSQTDYNNALDEQRTALEAQVCTGGEDYVCTIQPCLDDTLLGTCSSWCSSNGNLNYNSEAEVCYGETLRDGVFERRITDRLCPAGDTCSVAYCISNDENSYCNRGDDIYTFTNSGACENLSGIYDSETDTCVFTETTRR